MFESAVKFSTVPFHSTVRNTIMKLNYHRHDLGSCKDATSTNAGNELWGNKTPFSGCRISDLEGNRSNVSHVERQQGLNSERAVVGRNFGLLENMD